LAAAGLRILINVFAHVTMLRHKIYYVECSLYEVGRPTQRVSGHTQRRRQLQSAFCDAVLEGSTMHDSYIDTKPDAAYHNCMSVLTNYHFTAYIGTQFVTLIGSRNCNTNVSVISFMKFGYRSLKSVF